MTDGAEIDRRSLRRVAAARERIENLWVRGTDYCRQAAAEARANNLMLQLDLDLTGECKLKCFYCDRAPDRYSDVPNRVDLTTAERKYIINQARELIVRTRSGRRTDVRAVGRRVT